MSRKPLFRIVVLLLAVLCLGLGGWAMRPGLHDRPHFPHSKIIITRADGMPFSFDVEVARNEKEQEYGLMYIRSMPDGAGMIFPYNPPREVAFWMKNTYIPLDMLFVDANGRIGSIATNARPLDVMPIPSDVPVSSVVELNAGQVRKKGFAVGDKVDYAGLP